MGRGIKIDIKTFSFYQGIPKLYGANELSYSEEKNSLYPQIQFRRRSSFEEGHPNAGNTFGRWKRLWLEIENEIRTEIFIESIGANKYSDKSRREVLDLINIEMNKLMSELTHHHENTVIPLVDKFAYYTNDQLRMKVDRLEQHSKEIENLIKEYENLKNMSGNDNSYISETEKQKQKLSDEYEKALSEANELLKKKKKKYKKIKEKRKLISDQIRVAEIDELRMIKTIRESIDG